MADAFWDEADFPVDRGRGIISPDDPRLQVADPRRDALDQLIAAGVNPNVAAQEVDNLTRDRGNQGNFETAMAEALPNLLVRSRDGGPQGAGDVMPISSLVSGAPRAIQPFTREFVAPDPADVLKDKSVQFQLERGLDLLQKSALRGTGLNNTGTMRRIQEFGQGLASTAYADLYNRALGEYDRAHAIFRGNEGDRFMSERANRMDDQSILESNRRFGFDQARSDFDMDQALWGRGNLETDQNFNRLFRLSELGDPLRLGALSATYAGNAGNLITGAGDARAAGQVGAANATTGAIGAIGNTALNLGLLSRYRTPTAGIPYGVGPHIFR